ncbi:unnamed protein product [Polarella glacialis]|uniref:Uncharacterized protein n=1 Tax=Polarella glacialis TaxID=89957 RepID=A0A813LLW7_POLGL|nr:unnamed protein product [Polarella glacialis]
MSERNGDCEQPPPPHDAPNYPSAAEHADRIEATYIEERDLDMTSGPHDRATTAALCQCHEDELSCGALSGRLEGRYMEKLRTIHDATINDVNLWIRHRRPERTTFPGLFYAIYYPHRRMLIKQQAWRFMIAMIKNQRWINKVGTYGVASAQYHWGRMAALIFRLLYYTFPEIAWAFVYVEYYLMLLPESCDRVLPLTILLFLTALGLPLSWKKTGVGTKRTHEEVESLVGRLLWTTYICPTLRPILQFADPPRGLKLINDMYDTAAKVALEQFWGNEEYHRTVLGGAPKPKDTEELKEYVILGMNFPPSMFQIHLQFIQFPLLPFHDSQLQKGEHFTYRRFFPLGYLQKALALGDAVKMENVTMETDLETILEKVKAAGVDYDIFHAQIKKAHGLQHRLAGTAWKEDCFAYRVHGDQVTEKGSDGNFEVKPDMCSKQVQKDDAKALQNYGRPYKDDKPTGTYYKYAKEPKDVVGFCDVSR